MERISVEVLLKALLALSLITNLTTQGVKKLLDEMGKKYSSNLIAVIISAVSSVILAILYCTICKVPFTATVGACTVALIWVAFLLSTCGYDKVKQLIEQLFGK